MSRPTGSGDSSMLVAVVMILVAAYIVLGMIAIMLWRLWGWLFG